MADEDVAEAAKRNGTTRATASVDKAADIDGPVIYAVGNAPTALIRLCEHIEKGTFRPELVIGMPVGFVNVVQSKEMLIESGIPLITAVCGSEAVFYVSAFIVLINALQWTLGAVMLTGDRRLMKPAKVIRNPIVISVAVGLLLYILNLPKPVFVQNVFTTIIGMNTPLAMIVSGVFLANSDLMKIFGKKNIWLVSLIRLVVIPVLTLVLLKITPVGTQVMKTAVMICAACPVGSNWAVFARLYGKDDTEAVEYVCVTTILSLLTLPVAVMAVNML